jgi:hypothetical protein
MPALRDDSTMLGLLVADPERHPIAQHPKTSRRLRDVSL